MRTPALYQPGDAVRALVGTTSGTTLASGTVADCSPRDADRWTLRVRVCGTDHTFTVAHDGTDAHGYLERVPTRHDHRGTTDCRGTR